MLNSTDTGITKPFNPSDIDVEKKNMPVNTLIAMLSNNLIDLEPAFQRKKELWDETKQSQLIESLLLKLPLPSMYFQRDPSSGKFIVIDGLQRLCAIRNFAVTKELRLRNLEFLGDYYEHFGYDDLTFPEQLAIGMEEIVVNIFKGGTPDEAKFIIFKRLNSGGTTLTAQEIRNALYQGPGTELLRRVTEREEFISLGFNARRMQDRTAATRFYAFHLLGYPTYNGRMDDFLNQALKYMNSHISGIASAEELLLKAIWRCRLLFDGYNPYLLPGQIANPNRKVNPSLSFFDVLTVCVAELSDAQFRELEEKKDEFRWCLEDTIRYDEKFKDAIGQKSDRKNHTRYRYEMMSALISNTINA